MATELRRAPSRGRGRPASSGASGPATGSGRADEGAHGAPPPQPEEASRSVLLTSLAIFLAVASAAWMAGSLFDSDLARAICLVGPLIGVGVVGLSYRHRQPSLIQCLVLPVAAAAGAIIALATSHEPIGSLPRLVSDAVYAGGLGQPPVAFDPGWRFILVVSTAVLGAAAASLAVNLRRVLIGVAFAVPLTVLIGLILPASQAPVAATVAIALLIASLAVAHGAELARGNALTWRYEARRLGRAAAMLALLMGAMVALSNVSFLFPEPDRPQRGQPAQPDVQAPQADQVLFTVRAAQPGLWRVGVLDVYDSGRWLLPPQDRGRPHPVTSGSGLGGPVARGAETSATFTIAATSGHQIATLANPSGVDSPAAGILYDPRTQLLETREQPAKGLSYTVHAPTPPDGATLERVGAAPDSVKEFLQAPAPPERVRSLLARAPGTGWVRMEALRKDLHDHAVAAREGRPVAVTPERVAELLGGQKGTPFEITAADALLARWAGVPARLGYGYSGGDPRPGGELEVHPRHAATWLEAYFDGYGWVSLSTLPAQAEQSLGTGNKQDAPGVTRSQDVNLVLEIPIREQTIVLLYEVVRYWLLVSVPIVGALLLLWFSHPAIAKRIRSIRRRRWAAGRGEGAQIAVAYAEFRDLTGDLNVGHRRATPLEYLGYVEEDAEHSELAWLVTRGVWGDVRRDLNGGDVQAAQALGGSVARRMLKAQSGPARLLRLTSRTSLRRPFSNDIPNVWPWRGGASVGGGRSLLAALLLVPVVAAGAFAAWSAWGRPSPTQSGPPAAGLPHQPAPPRVGDVIFQREPLAERGFATAGPESLVGAGRVYTMRRGGEVEGYLQVATFRQDIDATPDHLRDGVLRNLAPGHRDLRWVRGAEIYQGPAGDNRIYLWFEPNGRYFDLMTVARRLPDPERTFVTVIDTQAAH